MSLAPIKVPPLQQGNPIVDDNGRPLKPFLRHLGDILDKIIGVTDSVNAALILARFAKQNAEDAQIAAEDAQASADQVARDLALQNSWIIPSVTLTSTPDTISMLGHTRYYADGTSVSIPPRTVEAPTTDAIWYVSYVDPERDGQGVVLETSLATPAQIGNRHVVGAVKVPTEGTRTGGLGPLPPGYVTI